MLILTLKTMLVQNYFSTWPTFHAQIMLLKKQSIFHFSMNFQARYQNGPLNITS